MEASTLTHLQRRGLFARPALLRFQGDERLVELTRAGHQAAYEVLVARYQSRLLAFCRQMLGSQEDAEDVLQEVFVAAYNAMVADEREIAVRPWLYRIARNRSLNHLRKPVPDGQDTMDVHPHDNGTTTHERVQNREEFRNLLADVEHLPETQRSALLLREMEALSYEEIARAMETTIPGVKSLLVRARIALAESSQARQLTCDEVRVELAEAAEGLNKASGPIRRHVRNCEPCHQFRDQLQSDRKVLAALFPAPALLALKGFLVGKVSGVFGGSSGAGTVSGATGAGTVGGAAGGAAGGFTSAVGATIGSKAAAGVVTAALITAGAVEVKNYTAQPSSEPDSAVREAAVTPPPVPVSPPPAAPPKEEVIQPIPVDPAAEEEPVAAEEKKKEPVASADSQETGGSVDYAGSVDSSGGEVSGGEGDFNGEPVPGAAPADDSATGYDALMAGL